MITPRFLILLACIAVVGVAFAQPPSSYAETAATETITPLKEVQVTLQEVVNAVEAYPGKEGLAERRKKLRTIIQPRFNFEEMAKRSLGPQWQKCTESEREEFIRVFSDLLASTYLSRIETVTRDMVSVDKEKVEFPRAIVRTTVTNKGDVFPIDYKLMNESGAWRVYDVVIENIGLVANYRNEFAGIIRREQFDGLMKRLREKSERMAQSEEGKAAA